MSEAVSQDKRPLMFLYGSETGNSESISKRLHQDAIELGYHSTWSPLKDYKRLGLDDLSKWPSYPIIFVTSSTGDGDPPANAEMFWRWLRRKPTDSSSLAHVRFVILGLGDSNYDSYQGFPTALFAKLTQLGAKPIIHLGKADEATSSLEDFIEPWITDLWPDLEEYFESGKLINIDHVSEAQAAQVQKLSELPPTPSNSTPISPSSTPIPSKQQQKTQDIQIAEKELTETKISTPSSSTPATTTPTVASPTTESNTKPKASAAKKTAKGPIIPKSPAHVSKIVFEEGEYTETVPEQPTESPTKESPFFAPIKNAQILTSDDAAKQVYEISLGVQGSGMSLIPGDAIGLLPQNAPELVDRMIKILNIQNCNQLFRLEPISVDPSKPLGALATHVKTPCSLKKCFTTDINLNGLISKRVLVLLAEYAKNPESKDYLMKLATDKDAYKTEIEDTCANIVDVLERFDDCKPDVGHLIDALSPLAPRYFSISNFVPPSSTDQQFRFIFSVVKTEIQQSKAFPSKTFLGVATNWLKGLADEWISQHQQNKNIEIKVPLFSRPRGEFILGADHSRPIIMVGPGTGVSPFVGFLEQREYLKNHESVHLGKSMLFTGHRHPDKDWLYKKELHHMEHHHILTHLVPAFSRKNPEKVQYVQHRMKEHKYAKRIVKLMENKNAIFYLCGDARSMAQGVREALIEVLQTELGIDSKQASDKILEWAKAKRYLLDIWG